MQVYRLTREKYATPLHGKGAALSTYNRWNSKGTEMIYTSENKALTILEVLVHLTENQIPNDYVLLSIDIPNDASMKTISTKNDLTISKSQCIGDEFIESNQYLVLRVPSAIVPGEFNLLINPFHPECKEVSIEQSEPFVFDWRLF